MNKDKVRKWLNITFLVLAAVGFALYFQEAYRFQGVIVIFVGMAVKVAEFFIRFML